MSSPDDIRYSRRDAFRLGGISVTLAALIAACGDNIRGDTAAGRIGNAPVITALPDYVVDDAVLLRTASSLEYTALYVYETAMGLDVFEGSTKTLVERLIEHHQATADTMGELTEAAGGVAWTDTNPWYMDRSVDPILASIAASDDPGRDVVNFAITVENIAASTHQTLTSLLSTSDQRLAVAAAATQEARHSATLVLVSFGTARRFSPALDRVEVERTNGVIPLYAVESTFGSVAQEELLVGPADENGARTSYLISTPAANSFVYNETEPA